MPASFPQKNRSLPNPCASVSYQHPFTTPGRKHWSTWPRTTLTRDHAISYEAPAKYSRVGVKGINRCVNSQRKGTPKFRLLPPEVQSSAVKNKERRQGSYYDGTTPACVFDANEAKEKYEYHGYHPCQQLIGGDSWESNISCVRSLSLSLSSSNFV